MSDQENPNPPVENTAPVDNPPVENSTTAEDDRVAYETYRKTVEAEKKAKAKLRENQEELERYKAIEQEREQKELEAKGEYQTIIAARDQKIKEQQERLEAIQASQSDNIRKQAFLSQLPATLLNPEYISFADLKSIGVDPESGQVDAVSLQAVKDKFLKSHFSLLKPQGSTPPTSQAPKENVTSTTTSSNQPKLSAKEKLRQQLELEQNR